MSQLGNVSSFRMVPKYGRAIPDLNGLSCECFVIILRSSHYWSEFISLVNPQLSSMLKFKDMNWCLISCMCMCSASIYVTHMDALAVTQSEAERIEELFFANSKDGCVSNCCPHPYILCSLSCNPVRTSPTALRLQSFSSSSNLLLDSAMSSDQFINALLEGFAYAFTTRENTVRKHSELELYIIDRQAHKLKYLGIDTTTNILVDSVKMWVSKNHYVLENLVEYAVMNVIHLLWSAETHTPADKVQRQDWVSEHSRLSLAHHSVHTHPTETKQFPVFFDSISRHTCTW